MRSFCCPRLPGVLILLGLAACREPVSIASPSASENPAAPLFSFALAAVQTWIQQSPTGAPPTGRYSAGMAHDDTNDRLIIFSGEAGGLPRPQDVWVLTDATGAGGTPSWMQLAPTGSPPLGRFGGTVVYAPGSNRIIVHGGCAANCGFALADTWVLTNANGLGGPQQWIQISVSLPANRAEHAAAYDPGNNRMMVFSGQQAFPGTERNDVWVLTNADGLGGIPQWTQLVPTGSLPGVRRGSEVAYDAANNRLIVFGGTTPSLVGLNDVWILTNANGLGGTPQWIQLVPSGGPPVGREDHMLEYDPTTNRAVLFGGLIHGGAGPHVFLNDVWVLTNANGLGGAPQWMQLSPSGTPPAMRAWVSSGYSASSNRLVIAMGRNDQVAPFLFNDVWVLALTTEVEIDIVPHMPDNRVFLTRLGVIPVAILTEPGFDAAQVNVSTVRFGATGTEAPARFPILADVDRDGDRDLMVWFRARLTGLGCASTSARLTGQTTGGQAFQGSDAISVVKC